MEKQWRNKHVKCRKPKTLQVVRFPYKENTVCHLQPLPPSTFRSAWGCLQHHIQTLKKANQPPHSSHMEPLTFTSRST